MAKVGSGIQMGLSWVFCENGYVPPRAIEAGSGVFICRLQHDDGDVVPGKVVPALGKAYLAWGGREHERYSYEVLCDSSLPNTSPCYTWEASSDGRVPKKAVVGGITTGGDPLYVARTFINGECVVGKVHHGHDTGYFPYGGEEKSESHYEVLVWKKK